MDVQKHKMNTIKISFLGLLGMEEKTIEDNLFNRVKALKNDNIFDVLTCSGYIKKNGVVIHTF